MLSITSFFERLIISLPCKRSLFIIIITSISYNLDSKLEAQSCGMGSPETIYPGVSEDYSSQSVNVRLYFVLIRETNGLGDIQEPLIDGLINELNTVYNPNGISFTRMCHFFFDNSDYYIDGCKLAGEYTKEKFDQYVSDDGITVFIQHNQCGTTSGQAGNYGSNKLWVSFESNNVKALSHEIGHCLNLYHSTEYSQGIDCKNDNTGQCLVKGDFVCDTPPDDRDVDWENNCVWNDINCHNDITCKDPCGEDLTPLVDNIMYHNNRTCRNSFTLGQFNRAKKSIMDHKGGYFDLPIADEIINENKVYSTPTFSMGSITIKAGKTLTISSTLSMPRSSKIIVESGASLIVQGGKITSNNVKKLCNGSLPGDHRFWYGIELQAALSGSSPRFICNNGTIELSEFGVHLQSGNPSGNYIINISNDSKFKDNKHSIYLRRKLAGGSFPVLLSDTRFYLTKTSAASSFPLSNYYSQIYADNATINISQCLFDNPNNILPVDDQSYAVRVMNTSLYVSGNATIKTVFKDDIYGILVSSFGTAKLFGATNCRFDKVRIGIRVNAGVNNYVIKDNVFFKVKEIGLWSNQSSGYVISNNNFDNGADMKPNYIGIQMEESGTSDNIIDNNIFTTSASVANKSIGINGVNNNGLQYRCNKTNYTSIDYLFDGTVSNIQGEEHNAAGNKAYGRNGIRFNLNNLSHTIIYYHRDNSPETPESNANLVPIKVATLNCNVSRNSNSGNRYDNYPVPNEMLQELKNQYSSTIDGGNSTYLLSLIQNADNQNAYSVYNELLNNSPWLSVPVVNEFYSNSTIFSDTQRYQIILQNPDNYRIANYASSLRNQSYSLPVAQLDALDTIVHSNTIRTSLESSISELSQHVSGICHEAIEYYKNPESYNLDSIVAWINRANNYKALREKVDLYRESGNYIDANSEINNLLSNNSLSASEYSDLQIYSNLLNLLNSTNQNDRYEGNFNTSELATLNQVAYSGSSQSAKEAEAVINFYYLPPPSIPIVNIKNQLEENKNFVKPVGIKESEYIVAYPNPVKEKLIIEMKLNELNIYSGVLIINDLFGIEKRKNILYDRINEINVSDLPSGIYLLTIKTSSQKIFYKKIYIIN